MLIGCYYRCPIPVEPGDEEHPRFFVLAQVIDYDEISDMVKVKMHDLLGSFQYYSEILAHDTFYAPTITRCAAIQGEKCNHNGEKALFYPKLNLVLMTSHIGTS